MANTKEFYIKVTYKNGYSHETVTAKNFGEACLLIFKRQEKLFHAVTGFELKEER